MKKKSALTAIRLMLREIAETRTQMLRIQAEIDALTKQTREALVKLKAGLRSQPRRPAKGVGSSEALSARSPAVTVIV